MAGGMGGGPPDPSEVQVRWNQRALENSRTQQSACKDQWDLIIESASEHTRAIDDLKRELALLRAEVASQREELGGCSSSVARLDRLITQHTQRMIGELKVDLESSMAHVEKRCQDEVRMIEHQILGTVDAKLKQQEFRASHEQEGRATGSEVWAGIKKEQYSHEVYIQDMLRRFGATLKEQDARTSTAEERVERLEKELRAVMKEHDTSSTSGKDEVRRFCTALKAGLDARVTCLHERVGDFEKGLDAHVDWVQGELRQLHARSQLEQERGTVCLDSSSRVDRQLDMHVDWVQGELRRLTGVIQAVEDRVSNPSQAEIRVERDLNVHVEWVKTELRQLHSALQVEQDTRAASSGELAGRLDEQLDSQAAWVQSQLSQVSTSIEERSGRCPEWTVRFEKELEGHVGWVKGELRHLGTSIREVQDQLQVDARRLDARLESEQQLQGDVRRLDAKLEAEQQAQRSERQEESRRSARLEGLLGEMDCRLLRVQDDLRGHWHKLSVTEHVQCGPAQPPSVAPSSKAEYDQKFARSPERTWEGFGSPERGGGEADDDVVVSGDALFGSPGRTEMPSVIESVEG